MKTSILILDKSLAKHADTIAFFRVGNDGFGLGAQRRAIDRNDLPQVQEELAAYLHALRARASTDTLALTTGLVVPKEKIAKNEDYSLSEGRYREAIISNTVYPLVSLERFMKKGAKTVDPRNFPEEMFDLWSIPAFDAGTSELLRGREIGSQKKVVFPDDVLLSRIIPHIRRGLVIQENSSARRQIASTEWIVFSSHEVVSEFLRQLLISDFFHVSFMQTITGVGGSLSRANPVAVGKIKIPLPPLEVQKEVVAEIEGYQKIINGARAVIDNYRPLIPIHPEWLVLRFEDAPFEIIDGDRGANYPKKEDYSPVGNCLFLNTKNVRDNGFSFSGMQFISREKDEELGKGKLSRGDVVLTTRGTIGNTGFYDNSVVFDHIRINSGMLIFRPDATQLSGRYLYHFFQSENFRTQTGTIFCPG